ncbi:TRAP-type C4-dicarboxylate transport system, small permease component [Loktanella fryxellensis]|uniref:TRAP transporter small permease protein n=1 Tax=Loktanella fryxellensis TaxID=245187 RepID=A0A1H8IU75_9RHOB|nr:TRAP transporter small permease [Loktanella fryxellensis]SEN72124.1 TRAP-type C4-dicarboxylate transport system, small permease component [Loktanella fryxellensis]
MDKLDRNIHLVLLWAIGVLILAMMTITFTQVLARYLFTNSLSWSEEAGRYIFVWITFLGLAAAFQSRAHIALDFLAQMLPTGPSRVLRIANAVLVAAVGLALIVGGQSLMGFGMNQRSAALGLPMYTIYAVIPFSGAMLLYFALRETWRLAMHSKEQTT